MADLFKTTKITQAVPGGPLQEQLVGAVQTSSGVADAGKIVLLSSTGQIDPSVGGSSVAVNLTPVSNPNFQDSGSVTWHVVGSNITATTVSGSVAFGAITSGSNTTATMTVGTGASIVTSGTGVVEGTELATTGSPVNVSNSAPPAHAGQLLISQPGNTTAVWADPLVQGLYPIGTAISTPINPVFIGASDGTNLQAILVDGSGNLKVAQQGSVTISGTVTVSSVTNPVTVTGTVSVSSVGGTVTVSGTVAATQSGSWSVSASQSGTWNIGTVATITNPVTVTGTVSASQSGSWTVAATQSGTWNIGTLTSITNPVAVTGTFFQATQPVSGTVAVSSVSGTVAVTQSTSPWVVSLASTTITGTVAVTQSTSPWVVSGTVTANQGTSPWISNIEASGTALTATGSSLNVNITGGSSSNTQYTGSPAVSAASLVTTAASGYDGANVRPLLTSTTGQLHVIADSGSTTVVTGTVAATQSGTWNIGTLTTITNPVAVTGTFFQATQPVSGTVAVTQSTSPWVVSLTSTTVTGTVAVTQSTSPWVVSNSGTFNVQPTTGGSSVYSHALNQDGSGNVGVNVENTVTVSGTFSGSTVTNVTPGTYVQNAGNSFSSSTTATLALTTNVVSGDTIFIGFSYTSTSTISSVVDNLGNQYHQVTTTGPQNSLDYALYYTTGAFAGATTVTVTFNASTSGEIVGVEYNGQVYLLTQTGSFGTGTTFTTGANSPVASSRANYIGIAFAYGQAGTLVTNNVSTTSSPGKAISPRFSNSNYMLGDCIMSEPNSIDFSWAQASSSGFAWILAQFALINATQVPLANATYFQKPGAWIPIGGVDTAGNSVTGGVVSVQGVSSSGLWIATDIFKQVTVALTSTASGIGGPTGFALPIAGQYQITQPLLTTSNSNGIIQLDIRGNQLTTVGVQTTVGTAWSSGTAINTFQYLPGNTTEGALLGVPAVYIQLDQTTPFSAGAVTFQGTYDNVNWVTIPVAQVLNPNTFVQLSNPYTFVASTQQPFLILMQGYQNIRMNLTSTITGAGTVTPYWAAQSVLPPLPLDAMPSTVANAPSQQTVTSSSASVLAANNSRRELRVTNTGTVAVYLGLGQTPTATAYHVALAACTGANDGTGGSYTSDVWKGAVNAIVASTSGTVVVTELT